MNKSILSRGSWLALPSFVLSTFAVSVVGGLVTSESVSTWYPGLRKPGWTPPDWLFGPVWSVLYAMMGVAAWLYWRQCGWERGRNGLALFYAQLGTNLLWSVAFFGLRSPALGLLDIGLLWLLIAATICRFGRGSRLAAALLVPYWLWVSYAAALNLAIWDLNG